MRRLHEEDDDDDDDDDDHDRDGVGDDDDETKQVQVRYLRHLIVIFRRPSLYLSLYLSKCC